MPSETISKADLGDGLNVLDLLTMVKLIPSKGEGRRLIQQNGLSINNEKVTTVDLMVTADMFGEDGLIIKKGKKTFLRLILE